MYFITPSDPGITLFGIDKTQIYGFGEKDGKLCIYTKSIFDIGRWKEYYAIDIYVVKCKCCDTGINVAAGICGVDQSQSPRDIIKKQAIWIAAREKKYIRIFSIVLETMKFTRYKMLHELYSEFALVNLDLCCKCIKPKFTFHTFIPNTISLIIAPQRYQSNVGIFHIRVTINQSNYCLLWKKTDSFKLVLPPVASLSNIFMNSNGEVFSVIERSKENGRIQKFSRESDVGQSNISFPDDGDINWIMHEVAFHSFDNLCLTRRRSEDGSSTLRLNAVVLSDNDINVNFNLLDYCTVDANFPSIDSTPFFISYRIVNKKYAYKTSNKTYFMLSRAIPSFIVFQTADACSIVVISFQVLSLSQSAYLSLARITQYRPLPVVQITCIDYFFQRIRKLFGLHRRKEDVSKKEEDEPWLSIEFIKQKIKWPRTLPLTKAPNLPMNSN